MGTLLSSKVLKSRKEHRCNWCGQIILIGEIYHKHGIVDEGSAYTWKSHTECNKLTQILNMFDEPEVTADDFHEHIICHYEDLTKQKATSFKESIKFIKDHYFNPKQQ